MFRENSFKNLYMRENFIYITISLRFSRYSSLCSGHITISLQEFCHFLQESYHSTRKNISLCGQESRSGLKYCWKALWGLKTKREHLRLHKRRGRRNIARKYDSKELLHIWGSFLMEFSMLFCLCDNLSPLKTWRRRAVTACLSLQRVYILDSWAPTSVLFTLFLSHILYSFSLLLNKIIVPTALSGLCHFCMAYFSQFRSQWERLSMAKIWCHTEDVYIWHQTESSWRLY